MKARWCISAIIFILTLFGVVNQQQSSIPNQEIVLQFTDVELTSEAVQHTIAKLKSQLQSIGVEKLKVENSENGQLRITYYSDADVASIQKKLLKAKRVALNYALNDEGQSKTPSKDIEISYNLDIYEIQKTNDFLSDLDGKFVLEPKLKNDRSSSPNFEMSINDVQCNDHCELVKVAYKVSRNISIEISDALHYIPEVRAGPNS